MGTWFQKSLIRCKGISLAISCSISSILYCCPIKSRMFCSSQKDNLCRGQSPTVGPDFRSQVQASGALEPEESSCA